MKRLDHCNRDCVEQQPDPQAVLLAAAQKLGLRRELANDSRAPHPQPEQKHAEDARTIPAQRYPTLRATYLSVADIERLRDQRLELLVQQARVTEQYVVNLKEREARLTEDVRRYRPYSDSPRAPVLPDHVAEDIVNTVNGLQVYQQALAKNTSEQQKLRGEFDSDIARFKELKGIK